MKVESIDLKDYYPVKGGTLKAITMSIPFDGDVENWKRPAVIVVPGGAYRMVSKREGEPVAMEFLAKGFQTFVLTYLCSPDEVSYPEQLIELASAVDYVKKHADEWSVNPEEVFVVGFSAGGHLTGNLAIEYESVSKKAGVKLDCKPTAVGLCYPVISQKHGHQGSYNNLLQGYTEEAKAELLKTLNLNEAVSETTPPAFIWATATDDAVPADNALRYAMAMAKNGLDYEIHVYPEGVHGLSTGHRDINLQLSEEAARTARWVDDCAYFFRRYSVEKF